MVSLKMPILIYLYSTLINRNQECKANDIFNRTFAGVANGTGTRKYDNRDNPTDRPFIINFNKRTESEQSDDIIKNAMRFEFKHQLTEIKNNLTKTNRQTQLQGGVEMKKETHEVN